MTRMLVYPSPRIRGMYRESRQRPYKGVLPDGYRVIDRERFPDRENIYLGYLTDEKRGVLDRVTAWLWWGYQWYRVLMGRG